MRRVGSPGKLGADALGDDQASFKQLFKLSPDPSWIIDGNRFVECNEAAVKVLGYANRDELLHVHPSKLSPPRQPDGEDSYIKAEAMMAIAKDKGLHRFEWIHTKANGTDFVAEVTLSAIQLPDRQVIYCVWRDITERKQMEDQIRQLAFYDPLTQLPNRRLLCDRLAQALAESKRTGRYGALMFLDLDKFKVINDIAGHAAGDQLLMQAAQRMKTCVREVDTVARFGGDEFVVVVGDLRADKAEAAVLAGSIAEKMRCTLAEPYMLRVKPDGTADATVEHRCTASVGVVVFIDHEGSQDDFLKLADRAMYRGKEAGSNAIRFYDLNA